MSKKFITTTLPYANGSGAHIGHAFEFLLADFIAEYWRYKNGFENVFLNVGLDEHGTKIYQQSIKENLSPQEFCDKQFIKWKNFCKDFNINYNNFYRTTDKTHKENFLLFFEEIKKDTYTKKYEGNYCVGCESFITKKEILYPNNCPIHKTNLIFLEEENLFLNLKKYSSHIKDTLIDKSLSLELENIIKDSFDLSITRKNVVWGIKHENGDTFYVWAEALSNYLFAAGYFRDRDEFILYWSNSLQICGHDNLKFQSYVFPAMCLAAGIPQAKEVLVHGIILDEKGNKMSKSENNIIDPVEQKNKFGLLPLKYYLVFGLNTYKNSKYSEKDLIELWNSDIVNGLGNTISRTLHLIDKKNVFLDYNSLSDDFKNKLNTEYNHIDSLFQDYEFSSIRLALINIIGQINERFNNEKPFDKNCINYAEILNELYFQLKNIMPFYQIILKEKSDDLKRAFEENKKVILFERI